MLCYTRTFEHVGRQCLHHQRHETVHQWKKHVRDHLLLFDTYSPCNHGVYRETRSRAHESAPRVSPSCTASRGPGLRWRAQNARARLPSTFLNVDSRGSIFARDFPRWDDARSAPQHPSRFFLSQERHCSCEIASRIAPYGSGSK